MAIKISGTTVVDNSRNLTNIGTIAASGNATFSGTGALKLPSGTDAQRPGSASVGMIRWNTTSGSAEIYDGTEFTAVGGGGGGGYLSIRLFDNSELLVPASSGTTITVTGRVTDTDIPLYALGS